MLIVRNITVEGTDYKVLISDNKEALHAAYAAGGAIIGIWNGQVQSGEEASEAADFSFCLYMVTEPEAVDGQMLERVIRRRMGMPWIIGETKRLVIREFKKEDPIEETDQPLYSDESAHVFSDKTRRDAYIDSQYRFYECGLWALEDKVTKRVAGKAGITDGFLGYHIYPAFRRQGYALEACEKILEYAKEDMELTEVFLKTKRENQPSVNLADRLGFKVLGEENGILCYGRRL